MAQFFIHRPVFAWVIALAIMLGGGLGITLLPISQYPEIAPPTVRISAPYSGASAEAVRNSVTTVIEDGMTGLDGLLYMTSTSSVGSSSISLVFDDTVDPDIAQVQVQNKLQLVTAQLPDAVTDAGLAVTRSTSSILMVGALVSTDGGMSAVELGDLLSERVEDRVRRVDGVGAINSFGSRYAMRIWLDPHRLAKYQLTPADVTEAVRAQNTQVSVGALGAQPAVPGQQLNATITAQSQLSTVAEFESIILKTERDGSTVRLADVARVEIGQESYAVESRFNGLPAAGFGVNLATGANAVETAAAVRETLAEIAPGLPEGVEIRYAYDTSPFVELSIQKVIWTLVEAIVLVFLVMFVFLQDWRATLIPTIAVPVVLLGTFGVLAVTGYSINTLTMFAMVLAIGLLVDDAIVVVENVVRVMAEEGLPPREATEKSMGQITGAIVGIALVLSAVFLPMAFFGGSTGVIYRQFSITIIAAMLLSAVVALVLTPALCASLLRLPREGRRRFAPARWFNRGFDRGTERYAGANRWLVRRPFRMLVGLAAIGALAALMFARLPSSFIPPEDQGVLMTMVNLPAGATTAQTERVVSEIETYYLEEESAAVESVFAALGFGFGGAGQEAALVFVKLRDFDERTDPALSAAAVAGRAMGRFLQIRAGQVIALQPPAIPGLGISAGFSMYLTDIGGNGTQALNAAADALVAAATQDPRTTSLRGNDQDVEAELRIDIDQQKAATFGLRLAEINAMLAVIFAGRDVNDFTLEEEIRPVIVQADAPWRMQPEDIDGWYARNADGEMVPFSAFATTDWQTGAPSLASYDGTPALELSGAAGPGTSSGDAMAAMEELAAGLPGGYGVAWTGLSYQERLSGSQAPLLYAISVLVVFLCLAALYESWTIPLAVMLSVPVGVAGALAAALLFDQSNDVYFKVGLLATIGLAAKNAILIVEFATKLESQGMALAEATVQAARLRLRPILMTSFAFMFGVLPLAIATGAGSASQNSIGIGVLGGVLAATAIGIFMVPTFYVIVRRLLGGASRPQPAPEQPVPPEQPAAGA